MHTINTRILEYIIPIIHFVYNLLITIALSFIPQNDCIIWLYFNGSTGSWYNHAADTGVRLLFRNAKLPLAVFLCEARPVATIRMPFGLLFGHRLKNALLLPPPAALRRSCPSGSSRPFRRTKKWILSDPFFRAPPGARKLFR